MSNEWKKGFKKALIDAVIADGSPVRDRPSEFGWAEYSSKEKRHLVAGTGIDYDRTTYDDSEWHEFMGTFYTGDTRVRGIDARIVLKDGSELRWRYRGTIGELISAVVRDA